MIGCSLAYLALAGPSFAQQSDEAKARAEARRLAEEGRALLESGKPREALASLRRAEAAFHAPTIVLLMAQARRDLGEVRAAVALYRRVVEEPLARDASPAFRSAHEMAEIELREARAKLSLVELELRPVGVRASVTVAGDEVSGAGPYEVDPGAATLIHVSAQGYEPAEQSVTVARGARERLVIELKPAGSTFERASRSPTPVFAGLGLMAVGLAVGIPTGIAAFNQKSQLAARCPTKVCPPDARDTYTSATLLADVSTSSFVMAGVGAALATAFLISSKGGRAWGTSSVRALPVASPGFVGAVGSF
ncbi:MAG: hypothetical protein QM820_64650 [Minicystis sp.]